MSLVVLQVRVRQQMSPVPSLLHSMQFARISNDMHCNISAIVQYITHATAAVHFSVPVDSAHDADAAFTAKSYKYDLLMVFGFI